MTASFNLIDERWIPCIRLSGEREELSLRETLSNAHNLREIHADSPPVTAALHRLLLAVLHSAFRGPKNRPSWERMWKSPQFDMTELDEYLAQYRHRFDLFDSEHPFYQARYPGAAKKSVVSLVLEMASGNNPTLFDHHTEDGTVALTPAQAGRVLITSQSFGFGGLSGMPEKFTDAPCAKGIIFFAVGDTLFQTLMLNLVRYTEDEPVPNLKGDDCPTWETEDPFEPSRSKPKGYLDYLTWHSRRIWLIPEQTTNGVLVRYMTWGPGLRLDAEDVDPMKRYYQDKKEGWRILSFTPDRALWRDSAPLFQLSDPKNRPPAVVAWLSRLANHNVLPFTYSYRLMALGVAKKRASLEFFRSEVLPLPLDYLKKENETLVSDLSKALQFAEDAGNLLQSRFPSLRSAVFTLARLVAAPTTTDDKLDQLPGKKDDTEVKRMLSLANSWAVERVYWSSLELHFHRLVNDLPQNPEAALDEWRAQLRCAANSAFEQAEAYAGQDRRTQRAVVKAREQFNRGLWQILSIKRKEETYDQEPT